MSTNINGKCVVKSWIFNLSWKQQTVLLSSLRGCDTVDKYDMSKKFIRRMRGTVLKNAATPDTEFMQAEITDEDVYEFTKSLDKYPIHFILHFVHAAEVIGYNHPDKEERDWWNNLYFTFVDAFHMKPENKEDNDFRLRDGVEVCCHKT